MELIKEILVIAAEIIDIIGVVILLFGFMKILFIYIRTEIKNILITLDFLIAADIIHTITDLSQEQLIELSVMILLRTAIGYFLGKEVDDIESKTGSVN